MCWQKIIPVISSIEFLSGFVFTLVILSSEERKRGVLRSMDCLWSRLVASDHLSLACS